MSNSFRSGLGRALGLGAAAVAALVLGYAFGLAKGKADCKTGQAEAQSDARGQAIRKASADVKRSAAVGRAREADAAQLDEFFQRLGEGRDVPYQPAGGCVLPDDRLRLWAAANIGPFGASAAATEHDGAAAAASATALGADGRPGGQPPGGGPALPPPGQPALPAAAAPAADAGRVPAVPSPDH